MLFRSSSVVLATGALALAAVFLQPAAAAWTSVHRDGTNNRFTPATDAPTDLTVAPAADTGSLNLQTGSAPVLSDALVFAVARRSGPNRVFLRAFSKHDLSLQWTSPDLDATSETFSLSSPTYQASDNALYFGTGSTMFKLSAATGQVLWSTPMTSANTQSGSKYTITNASPVVAGGRVYIHTYGGFSGPYLTTQLVAFDATTGAVDWSAIAGGIGTASPVFYDDPDVADPDLLIASTGNASNNGGMKAFNAATGALVWDSASVAMPWATANLIWAEATLVPASGKLFAVTYNFSGTNGQLLRVDAATGFLDYGAASLTADSPPIVNAGEVVVLGGPFGIGELERHLSIDGSVAGSTSVSGSIFRNHPTLTAEDGLYLSIGDEGTRRFAGPGLSLASTTSDLSYSGPTVIDDNGDLYVKTGGAMRVFRVGPTAVLSLGQSSPTSGELLEFDVAFNQAVAPTFDGSDVVLVGSLAGSATVRGVTGTDPNYTALVEITAPNSDGTLGIAVLPTVQNAGGANFSGGVSPLYTVANGGVLFAREDYNRDGAVNVGDVTDLANNVANGVSLP